MRPALCLAAVVAFLAAACGSPTPTTSSTTAVVDACAASDVPDVGASKPQFGEPCVPAIGCDADLVCQDSEFAAFPWCTRACSKAGTHCDEDLLGGRKGFCVEMPAGWRGPSGAFCAPECFKSADCKALAPWEACEKPEYKAKTLYNDLPVLICASPSSHGAPWVDPATCLYEAQYPDNVKYGEAKAWAKAYCQVLDTCKLRGKCTSPQCCMWHAFRYLTPGGKPDNARIAALKCWDKSFTANKDTPGICTSWQLDCAQFLVDGKLPVQ